MLSGWRLRWQSRPSLVDQVLARAPQEPVVPSTAGLVRVASIQMAVRAIDDPVHWIEQCQALTQAAVRVGVHLLVFPALAPWGLVNALGDAALGRAFFASPGEAPVAAQWAAYNRLYPALYRLYHRTFSYLAHRYHLTIAVGGLPAPRRQHVTLVANVFTADGRLRLRQPAVSAGRLVATPELPFVHVNGYRMTAVIGDETNDSWLAPAALAVDIDLISVLSPGGSTSADAAVGLAATSGLYVVRSCMVDESDASGMRGSSGIYAPVELSDDGTGVLREVASDHAEEVIVATLDLARRRKHPPTD